MKNYKVIKKYILDNAPYNFGVPEKLSFNLHEEKFYPPLELHDSINSCSVVINYPLSQIGKINFSPDDIKWNFNSKEKRYYIGRYSADYIQNIVKNLTKGYAPLLNLSFIPEEKKFDILYEKTGLETLIVCILSANDCFSTLFSFDMENKKYLPVIIKKRVNKLIKESQASFV